MAKIPGLSFILLKTLQPSPSLKHLTPVLCWNHPFPRPLPSHRLSAEIPNSFPRKHEMPAGQPPPSQPGWERNQQSSFLEEKKTSRARISLEKLLLLPNRCTQLVPDPLERGELGRGAGITFVGGFEAQQVADTVGLEQEPHLVLGADDEVGDGGAREAAKKHQQQQINSLEASSDSPTLK